MTALERAALDRIEALEQLLVCYRVSKRPTNKLHDELARTREAIAEALKAVTQ